LIFAHLNFVALVVALSGYHESGKLVLQLIANPNLPPKEQLFRTSDTVIEGISLLGRDANYGN
jgi:hypothetical protein